MAFLDGYGRKKRTGVLFERKRMIGMRGSILRQSFAKGFSEAHRIFAYGAGGKVLKFWDGSAWKIVTLTS